MGAVNQYAELHLLGTSLAKQGIQGGANGPAGVENVIDQDDVLAGDREPNLGLLHHRFRAQGGEVVAIQSDVQGADRDRSFLDACDHLSQALGNRHSSPADAHQSELGGAVVLLDDFVDQPYQGTLDFGGGHQLRLLAQVGLTGRWFWSHKRCIIRGRPEAEQGGLATDDLKVPESGGYEDSEGRPLATAMGCVQGQELSPSRQNVRGNSKLPDRNQLANQSCARRHDHHALWLPISHVTLAGRDFSGSGRDYRLCIARLPGVRPLLQRLSPLGQSRNDLLPSVGGRQSSGRSGLSQAEPRSAERILELAAQSSRRSRSRSRP